MEDIKNKDATKVKETQNNQAENLITDDDQVIVNISNENGEAKVDAKISKATRLKAQIKELEDEVYELKDKLLRNEAELINFKKRLMQENIQDRKYANQDLIADLLISLDQLDKVFNVEVSDDKLKNYLIGFKMINTQIFDVLEAAGLKYIKVINEVFDPRFHHAVEKENNQEVPNGTIIKELQKGYMFKDRLLRPAMVVVNEWSE